MKKIFFLGVVILTTLSGYGQINTNAINVNSYADVLLKRSGVGNFKIAMSVSGDQNTLILNYNNDYSNGIRINGKTVTDEVSVFTNGTTSKHLGFSTHDQFTYLGYPIAHYGMTLRPGNNLGISGHQSLEFFTAGGIKMKILQNGNVGIGSVNPDEKLTVKGKIHAEEIKVDLVVPADYVFQKYFTGNSDLKPEYTMPTLAEVEFFVKENNHLPSIPSAKEIQENGLHLGEMNNLLLQKVEELTLYIIEQNKRIEALEAKVVENN